jgi:hypothetical protein
MCQPYETIAFKVFLILIVIILILYYHYYIHVLYQTASKFVRVLHAHTLCLSLSHTLNLTQVPNQEIDTTASKFFTNWDFENKTFTLQEKQNP